MDLSNISAGDATAPRKPFHKLHHRATEKLGLAITIHYLRALTTVIWAIDDEAREPKRIIDEAHALIRRGPEAVRSRLSPRLTREVARELGTVARTSLALRRQLAPSAPAWYEHRQQDSYSAILRDLQIRSLTDFRSNQPYDLQADAIVHVEERYRLAIKRAVESLPHEARHLSTQLHGKRWAFWPAYRDRLATDYVVQLFALSDNFDPIKLARGGYRSTLRKRTASSRTADEVEFSDELLPKSKLDPLLPYIRNEAALFKRAAFKRWGQQGTSFVEALAEGASVEEASQTAGISLATAKRRLRTLREL